MKSKRLISLLLAALMLAAFQVYAKDKKGKNTEEKMDPTELDEVEEPSLVREQKFHISGFIDFQFQYSMLESNKNPAKIYLKTQKHFTVSNLNLYLKFNVARGWEVFSEIRFLYVPEGMKTPWSDVSDPTVSVLPQKILFYPVDTSFYDNNVVMGKYGSIGIERAYIEWNRHDFAKIRAGHFLSPYGIWSQDHGAPVVTSIRTPVIAAAPVPLIGMPRSQTGLEFLGKVNIPGINTLFEYAIYGTNGNSVDAAVANEHNSGFNYGAFLNFKLPSIQKTTDIDFGGSAYRGERVYPFYQYSVPLFILGPEGFMSMNPYFIPMLDKYKIRQTDTMAMAHLRIAFNNLPADSTIILQGEYLQAWVHEYGLGSLVGLSGFVKRPENYLYYMTYGQFEWQFMGWLTPYFRYEYVQFTSSDTTLTAQGKKFHLFIGGLNIRIIPEVVLKLEYNYTMLYNASNLLAITDPTDIANSKIFPYKTNNNIHQVQASLSVAF
ncbi:MAG: hypothetical protein JW807_10695 [Spirochaetes bacterium]|nr:hypothetical protein [Spirochaetota bacterium]